MSESVMRQEMETWLKSECVDVGTSFLLARDALEMATEHISELQDLRYYYYRKNCIETGLNSAVDSMVGISPKLLPIPNRREIFDSQNTIKGVLLLPASSITDEDIETIRSNLHRLRELTQKYLLEKVVECQVGKPPISHGKWEITIPTDIEALFAKGVITDDERSYLLLELHKGPFTIQEGKITRSGESGSLETTLEHSSLTDKWYNRGVEAGKTDTWMDIENTIKETAEHHPEIKEEADLVFTDVEQWKQTDHYRIKYGNQMWKDAPNEEVYPELEVMFWQGYIEGRKQIGKDIFAIASELVKGR